MRHAVMAVVVFVGVSGGTFAAQHDTHATGAAPAAKTGGAAAQAKIRQALSAAPPEISKGAGVMDWPDKDGAPMKMLRASKNGWTCMPSSPGDGPASTQNPMCLDKTFMDWADAHLGKKDPPTKTVGVGYMLHGDKGASNTDPFATGPTPDNQWVVSGPHVMMIFPNMSQLDVFPTDFRAGGPWVMWKGTKYAHLMVPITAMPKAAAK
jgi:hypothetical protein